MNANNRPGVPAGPQTCEFCNQAPSDVVIHAKHQGFPTYSVLACAGCFTKLLEGHELRDIFDFLWDMSDDGKFSARAPGSKEGEW